MPILMVVDDSDVDRLLVGGILQSGIKDSRIVYAEDGSQAIQQIETSKPDLVVTDLQMPNKDGLELVSAIRIQYPSVPVILITAHGSEGLAVEALQRGASSYVSKTHIQEDLVDTVEDVLNLAHTDRSYARLMACLNDSRFHFQLENDPDLVDPLIDLVQQTVSGMGLCDPTGGFRIGMALKEAVLNGIYHGNLGLTSEQYHNKDTRAQLLTERQQDPAYAARCVNVTAQMSDDKACFVVTDSGQGFDTAAFVCDEGKPLEVSTEGRGLVLMQSFCDSVTFNDQGNAVTLTANRIES